MNEHRPRSVPAGDEVEDLLDMPRLGKRIALERLGDVVQRQPQVAPGTLFSGQTMIIASNTYTSAWNRTR